MERPRLEFGAQLSDQSVLRRPQSRSGSVRLRTHGRIMFARVQCRDGASLQRPC